tara:strand:- start:390 stop:689 length:300 start_codon:yes stop_codon:yes gene_type:complete
MTAIFEALKNFQPKKVPKPTVTIDGQKIEVDEKMFREIIKHGEDCFILKNGKIEMKPMTKNMKGYPVLKASSEKGHHMHDGHPYWPDSFKEGGYTWQTE